MSDLLLPENMLVPMNLGTPDLTKTAIEEMSKRVVIPVTRGDLNPLVARIVSHYWAKVMEKVIEMTNKQAYDEAQKYRDPKDRVLLGCAFESYYKNGALNYNEDPVIKDLNNKIKARKKLIQSKFENPGMEIIDTATGQTVETVSQKEGSEVVSIEHLDR